MCKVFPRGLQQTLLRSPGSSLPAFYGWSHPESQGPPKFPLSTQSSNRHLLFDIHNVMEAMEAQTSRPGYAGCCSPHVQATVAVRRASSITLGGDPWGRSGSAAGRRVTTCCSQSAATEPSLQVQRHADVEDSCYHVCFCCHKGLLQRWERHCLWDTNLEAWGQ